MATFCLTPEQVRLVLEWQNDMDGEIITREEHEKLTQQMEDFLEMIK